MISHILFKCHQSEFRGVIEKKKKKEELTNLSMGALVATHGRRNSTERSKARDVMEIESVKSGSLFSKMSEPKTGKRIVAQSLSM